MLAPLATEFMYSSSPFPFSFFLSLQQRLVGGGARVIEEAEGSLGFLPADVVDGVGHVLCLLQRGTQEGGEEREGRVSGD